MIPNWALEKYAWLGAGLIWKRVHASGCTNRLEEEEPERQKPKAARTQKKASGPLKPWKAVPLIHPWDSSYKETYHTDFDPSRAHRDLSWRCPLTSLADGHYNNQDVMYGIVGPDRPWMLSPPELPVAGATDRSPDEVKVMAYHGLTYSHSGLIDPSVMPGYVAFAKHKHEQTLRWTGLDPELPKWSEVSGWFENGDWDLGKDMQAYARPDGAERSMIYDAESKTWNARPREPQPVPKKRAKGKPPPVKKDKKKEEARPKRKRKHGSTTSKGAKDETREVVNVKPKDPELDVKEDVAPAAEAAADIEETPVVQTKGVTLKSASDPAVKEKVDALLGEKTAGEKEPHPQAGRAISEKAPKEETDDDPYAKAPHGDSSDDDEVLEAKLRSLSEIPHPRPSSEARSDKAAYDKDERRSVPSSSPAKREKKKKRAGKATDVQSATGEEPMKRKKKSKHGSKKAAKKSSRSRPSQAPEAEGYELDMEGIPGDKLERTLTAMHRVKSGLEGQQR